MRTTIDPILTEFLPVCVLIEVQLSCTLTLTLTLTRNDSHSYVCSAPWAANISLVRDWKLLTIFTGLDDVVFYNSTVQPPTKSSTPADLFATNFDKLLTAIHEQLPKTFVNMSLSQNNRLTWYSLF